MFCTCFRKTPQRKTFLHLKLKDEEGAVSSCTFSVLSMPAIRYGGLGLNRKWQSNITGTQAIGYDGDLWWSQEPQPSDIGDPLYHTEGAFRVLRWVQVLVCFLIKRLTRMAQDSQILRIPGEIRGKRSWKRFFQAFRRGSRALSP